MHEIHVGMLGARSVGKTSLLAVMYKCFSETIGNVDLQLLADQGSEAKLATRLGELAKFPDSIRHGGVGLEMDLVESTYTFDLGRKARPATLRTVFHDYPGEFLLEKAASRDRERVQEVAGKCAAVLIPVDSPALMEKDGCWHELINRPLQVSGILKRAYQDLASPRLVILAAVRCEKYLAENRGDKLLATLKSKYKELLDHLRCDSLCDKVAVVVTPIQTVGAVQFSHVDEVDGTPVFRFTKADYNAKFSPTGSEQILGYLLRFLLRLHLNQRRWEIGILDWVRDWFGTDTHLKNAITSFSQKTNAASPLAILQGEPLL